MVRKKHLSQSVKATIAFTIANTISQGLNLLVTPIFVRLMSTEEIGNVTNFNSWATLLGIVINMMLYGNSYVIAISDYPDEKDEYSSCALSISMISTCVFGFVYFLAPHFFQKIFGISGNLMILMLLGFLFMPGTLMWLTRQRFEYKYISVLIVSASSAILATVLSLVFVYFSETIGLDKSEARLFATYFINIAIGIFFSAQILFRGRKVFSTKFFWFILSVNTPMIVHTLAKTLLDISDRIMIANMVGKSEAGIYGTVYSICTLIMILWNAINAAILPYMFSKMKEIKKNDRELKGFLNGLLLFFLLLSMVFILVAPEIIGLFTTRSYMGALTIVPPVVAGCFLTAVYSLIGNVLLFNKKTASIMLGTLCGGGVNVFLNWLLIPLCGYQVAAYTTVFGYVVLTLVLYVSMRRLQNDTGDFFDGRYACILSIVMFTLGGLISLLYPYTVLRFCIIVFALFIGFMYRNRLIKAYQSVKEGR